MNLGVIIPTCGHWPYAIRTIQTLLASTPDAIAIVIDDASADWSPDYPARLQSLGAPGRVIVQRYQKAAGLTRSWNAGLRICRQMGIEYAVPANSDLAFAPGWWAPIESAISGGSTYCGPITNAPGHSGGQQVASWLPGYSVDDTDSAISATGDQLKQYAGTVHTTDRLNGFCFAGQTESFWQHAKTPNDVFDPAFPLAGNEDEFFGRAKSAGARLSIVPASFVFHYRGVTRNGEKLSTGKVRNEALPGMGALAPAAAAAVKAKKQLRPECVHLGRMTAPVAGLRHCQQKRWCDLLGREIVRCTDCEKCPAHEAV